MLAALPLGIGVLQTFGILGMLNLPLNPANMIALPLMLGLGVDYGVHIVHDYLEQRGPLPDVGLDGRGRARRLADDDRRLRRADDRQSSRPAKPRPRADDRRDAAACSRRSSCCRPCSPG